MKIKVLCFCIPMFICSFSSDPDAESLFKSGEKNLANKEYIKAVQDFTAAISLKPDFGKAYLFRAKAKMLFHQQMASNGMEFCFDLIQALQLGEVESELLLRDACDDQCFDAEKALIEPDIVLCADFSSKILTEMPEGSENMENLFKLNLFNNRFSHVSSTFSKFPALLVLDLSSNRVQSIDPSLGKLQNLTELNLSKNQLSSLPDEIGELKKIKHLNLHGNQLVDLPATLSKCKELEHLDLSNNKLSAIPEEILLLKKLKTLKLSGNTLDKKTQKTISESLYNTEVYF